LKRKREEEEEEADKERASLDHTHVLGDEKRR